MKILFITNRPDISFGLQAQILEKALTELGNEIKDIDHTAPLRTKVNLLQSFKPDVVVIWTYFNDIGHPTITIEEFRAMTKGERNFMLIGFEVSDTDRLSQKAIEMTNEYEFDLLLTPSEWSAQGFIGVNAPVVVLPHALSYYFYEPSRKYKLHIPSIENGNKNVYIYAQHSFDRKGTDIAIYGVNEEWKKRQDFNVIVKTMQAGKTIMDEIKPPKYVMRGFVSEAFHYSIFKKANVFFYPVRGGAFEIPVLEALALGLTVIIPEKGAWVDIPLNKDDVYWIKVDGLKKYWFDNSYHIGNFIEPNKDDALDKLDEALNNPKNVNVNEYLKEYSPKNIASQFLELIKK